MTVRSVSNAFTLGGLSGTGSIALNNNAASPAPIALTVGSNNATATYSIAFTGSGSLVKAGTGTLTLAASSNYSGGTTISSGIVAATNNSAFGNSSGTVAVATGGEIYNTTALTIANPLSLSGSGVSGMSLRQGGSSAGTYSGPVALAGNTTLSADSGSSLTFSNNLALNGNTLTFNSGSTVTVSGNIGAAGGDSGAIVSNGSQVLFSGSNSYSGGTTVGAGMLIATTTAALPYYSLAGSVSVLSGATLRVNAGGNGWTSGNVNALWQNAKFAGGSILGIDTTNGSLSDGSNISGNFGLAVSGSNMLTLSGTSSYFGPTTISGGTLNVTGALPATGAIINGGTLVAAGPLGGLSLISGGLTLASTSISTLSAGTASIGAGTQLSNIIVGSSGISSQIQATSLTLAASGAPITVNLTDNGGANGQGSAGAAGSIYPIISYTSLSGAPGTFRVGTKPASLASNGIGFFVAPATNTVDMAVTALNPLVYQDTFNRSGALNGSLPTIQNGANNTWTASPSWSTSASAGGLATTGATAAIATNLLPFVPVTGNIYTLTGVLNCTTTNTNWLALGFTNSAATTGSINAGSTLAWALERGNMTGSNSGNYDQAYSLGAGGNLPTNFQYAQASGAQNFTMVLNTTGGLGSSTIYWLVNGQIASSASGLNLTGANTVADIAFAAGGGTGATGTVSNLSLASGSVWLGRPGSRDPPQAGPTARWRTPRPGPSRWPAGAPGRSRLRPARRPPSAVPPGPPTRRSRSTAAATWANSPSPTAS